jgi:hypothetical protein
MHPLLRRSVAAVCLSTIVIAPACAQKAAATPRVAANNSAQLRKLVGKTVTVYGKVSRAATSRSGHHFLNFYATDFSAVCFQEDVDKFKGGGPAKKYADKEIEVTGRLELYRGKPQIKLRTPDQISLVKADTQPTKPDDASTADAQSGQGKELGFPLKQIDELTWLSPAGLRFKGKDPEGLTRVEHVLRHAQDQPKRAGPHGVFDGGKDRALATIDEAWKKVKTQRIRPKQESGRSSYVVPMGKRVGYLGGRLGKSRRNPPLTRVFIVVKSGTSDIVTAFPR